MVQAGRPWSPSCTLLITNALFPNTTSKSSQVGNPPRKARSSVRIRMRCLSPPPRRVCTLSRSRKIHSTTQPLCNPDCYTGLTRAEAPSPEAGRFPLHLPCQFGALRRSSARDEQPLGAALVAILEPRHRDNLFGGEATSDEQECLTSLIGGCSESVRPIYCVVMNSIFLSEGPHGHVKLWHGSRDRT